MRAKPFGRAGKAAHRVARFAQLSGVLAGLLLAVAAAAAGNADPADRIRARGTLVVGTKADYQPFGFRNRAGNIVGFEPDLAAEVAKALAVPLKLVPVVASTRVPMLDAGDVDLVIATMNDTPERRKLVDFAEPAYYASGVNALAPKAAHLHVWQQLRGKPVCSVEGSFYLVEIKDRYGPELRTFKDTNEVYEAVKSGDCFGVYDDTAIIGQLQKPEWQDYEMPLHSILAQPWGIAVRKGQPELVAMLGELVKGWHRNDRIQELERTWHIPPSFFAEEMHRRYGSDE
ncbi:MAG: transporter substrate-binding domain-containing protein [Alphaproteobacteria bacterium]|nr:transporter substrate-binding domain-containing protein [Alphaproteobacteria bacterium]